MPYIDLTDTNTYNAIVDTLVNYYGLDEKLVEFAFSSYGCNEDTLDHITYYYGIERGQLTKTRGTRYRRRGRRLKSPNSWHSCGECQASDLLVC